MMITVKYGEIPVTMEPAQLVPWLFGFNRIVPGALPLRTTVEFTQDIEIFTDRTITTKGERYSIRIGGADTELPADWVLPWSSGLAARQGTDLLVSLDSHIHERNRRMQALMICHQNRWLEYNGITEGNRS